MSVLINGSLTKPFNIGKGLIQGDPLSPFIFVLVAKVLNKLLEKAKEGGFVKSLKVGKNMIELSHLQFTDDTILFCPAKEEVIINFKRILNYFGIMSGLKDNFKKSALIPFKRYEEWVEKIKSKLGCSVVLLPITYLGIPLGANPKRVETWRPIIEKNREKAKWVESEPDFPS